VSDSFKAAIGRKVVSRASAEEVGRLEHLVVDVAARRVACLVVGKGRRGRLVDWEHLSGFGPDAIVIDDEASLRPAEEPWEKAAAHGGRGLLGMRALSELGNEAGKVDDVVFAPDSGEISGIVVGPREHPGEALLGAGSYAVILGAAADAPPTEA
jgi:sporulation protein YlmC with PRC-barrel domain